MTKLIWVWISATLLLAASLAFPTAGNAACVASARVIEFADGSEPDSKAYICANRLRASWMQAIVLKAARVSARFS